MGGEERDGASMNDSQRGPLTLPSTVTIQSTIGTAFAGAMPPSNACMDSNKINTRQVGCCTKFRKLYETRRAIALL